VEFALFVARRRGIRPLYWSELYRAANIIIPNLQNKFIFLISHASLMHSGQDILLKVSNLILRQYHPYFSTSTMQGAFIIVIQLSWFSFGVPNIKVLYGINL